MPKDPTLRERMAVVETEMKYVKMGLGELKKSLSSNTEAVQSLSVCVEKKLRGSLSGKEKASIWIAVITSIGAIVVAFVTNLPTIMRLVGF